MQNNGEGFLSNLLRRSVCVGAATLKKLYLLLCILKKLQIGITCGLQHIKLIINWGNAMLLIYVTMPSMEEAKTIASNIVEKRLAACANIIPGMHSIYHWQGKIEQSTEYVCLFKTRKENFNALQEAITQLHSYITPCIIALPIVDAAAPFAKWIQEESMQK